jgi:predicted  nucleic acid-binding Zn-ribbon protein
MHADLEKLIALQQAEVELRRVEGQLRDVPRARSEMEARLAAERGRLDAARSALADSQKGRKQHEGALQDFEAKRSKYKGQLMEVKTNKEYTAMLHEIEGVEREIREREDHILAEMERAEGLVAEVKDEESLFKAVEEKARAEAESLASEERKLEEERTRLQAARDATAATVPEEAMQLFQRVARLRGVAVAEARDDMCQLCHVKLRPQLYVELKKNESIVQCAHCSRILYYVPTAPAVAPGP